MITSVAVHPPETHQITTRRAVTYRWLLKQRPSVAQPQMAPRRHGTTAPDPRDVTFERRGLHASSAEQQANLEKVGGLFVEGFGYGLTGRDIAAIESSLEAVERPFRGFAYEGCAMALACAMSKLYAVAYDGIV